MYVIKSFTLENGFDVYVLYGFRLNNVQKEAKESDVQINYYFFLILLISSLFFKSFSNDVVTCIG